MKVGRRALPSARLAAPASRNSLTRRSCKVLLARSTRPLAGLRIGADDVDVERVQGPAKLGHPVTAKGGSLQQLGDSSEHVELLAVKVIIAIKDCRSIKLQ